jgi:hypothetical protein
MGSATQWRTGLLLLSLVPAAVSTVDADRGALLAYQMAVGIDTVASQPKLEKR